MVLRAKIASSAGSSSNSSNADSVVAANVAATAAAVVAASSNAAANCLLRNCNDNASKLRRANTDAVKSPRNSLNSYSNCKMTKVVNATATSTQSNNNNTNNNNNKNSSNNNDNKLAFTATTTTTIRSSSMSALLVAPASCIRPQTLNVHNPREAPTQQTQLFFGEVLNAWRAKARCNVVPAERTQELFHELSFNPSEKQISEMLQTAKMLARKGKSNGLTFGEFCVLAADLKRFRTSTFQSPSICDRVEFLSSLQNPTTQSSENASVEPSVAAANDSNCSDCSGRAQQHNAGSSCGHNNRLNCSNYSTAATATPATGKELRSTKSFSSVDDCKRKTCSSNNSSATGKSGTSEPVEVFLGGSCNPTTWRADVAIPALNELGISFYNPQVSDWTPDLIELEHRAKEKARVLFFVMDSETRASAGAIEAAHIAGQNCKQLVLVLHPYKPNQYILNEPISQQEYVDLLRNQMILKELVTRRGLPVLDNIPSGLQRTKEILAGIRDPPSNIASVLVVIRGAFDRVGPVNDLISLEQCQRALSYLGYAQSLLSLDNLNKILITQRETLNALKLEQTAGSNCDSSSSSALGANSTQLDFDMFCIISAYLSVLQQEIHESGCISPIKGTNVPPPPVYLANMQGEESFALNYYAIKNISRTSSQNSVPPTNSSSGSSINYDERQSLNDLLVRSRDSGTSSPQPQQLDAMPNFKARFAPQLALSSLTTTVGSTSTATTTADDDDEDAPAEDESDSNDSVFSSSSSINSVTLSGSGADLLQHSCSSPGLDFRDVYLGGSCFLRSKWRQQLAMPYLKSQGVSYHLPALHESIPPAQLDLPNSVYEELRRESTGVLTGSSTRIHTRRKYQRLQEEPAEHDSDAEQTGSTQQPATLSASSVSEISNFSWTLLPVRANLYNPLLLDSSRVLLFVITNETRSLAPMTLAAHCIGLMYNVVLAVQMLPDDCVIGKEKLTPAAIKDYNRGRSYLIDLAKRQGVPVFSDIQKALECTVEKAKACNSRNHAPQSRSD